MKLILIRHAESQANARGIKQGQKIDMSLSKLGKEQAKRLAERLKDEKIEAIYSSDLKRAMETAEVIAKAHKLKVIPDKRLREKDHDNESHKSHEERCKSFLAEMWHKGTIVIVSHGGTNRIIIALSTGDREKGSKLFNSIKQGNSCINIIEKKTGGCKIHLINCMKHLKPDKKLIRLFEKVQKIPYQVCKFDLSEIDESLEFGDCRHKSALLKKLLEKNGYKARVYKVIFDWKDLPIPKKILKILKKSSTVWVHDAVGVKLYGDLIFLDPTWDPRLEKKGFPITKNWSGLENTKQVTEGELEFHREDNFNLQKEEILKKHRIRIDQEEAHKFAEALNKWLEED